MRAALWAVGLVVLGVAGAAAQELPADGPLHTLSTADETRGWEAVGRLNLGSSGFCTASLIAPDVILTAAHCLYDKFTGKAFDPSVMEFLAGWRNGRAVAYRGIKRAIAHPDYIYEGPEKMDRVAFDLAVLELDQPIRLPSVQPFRTGAVPADGDIVGVVSYALDRSEAPSLQENCHVLGRQPGVLVLSCNVDFGSSGAPIFKIGSDLPEIVSVVSAKAEMDEEVVALGTEMAEPLAELLAVASDETVGIRAGRLKPVPGLTMSGGTEVGSGGGGAKFVKP
jgi:V8-like Glu-specific endopeptidase